MPTYSVLCELEIPTSGDEPIEISAIATIAVDSNDHERWLSVTLESDGRDLLGRPGSDPVYLKSYIAYVPTPGATQWDLDAELRLALREYGWMVL